MLHALFAGVSILSLPPLTHTPLLQFEFVFPSPSPSFSATILPPIPCPAAWCPDAALYQLPRLLEPTARRASGAHIDHKHKPTLPATPGPTANFRHTVAAFCGFFFFCFVKKNTSRVRTGVDGGEEGRYKTDSSTYALSLSLGWV